MTKSSTIIMALAIGYILGTKSKKQLPVQLQKPCYCPKPGTAANPMLVMPTASAAKPAIGRATNLRPSRPNVFSITNTR